MRGIAEEEAGQYFDRLDANRRLRQVVGAALTVRRLGAAAARRVRERDRNAEGSERERGKRRTNRRMWLLFDYCLVFRTLGALLVGFGLAC